ncbi:DUF3325 domain-containing protein [Acinetobacter sp. ANC 3813]|uniref:DUF3325 domain-containing protein n=1 Tax=Acinetobacter sp. ANC 3813 TaxID=1977873 RepID=UPI000A331474|nr:DUF3325 domain-containing protein [Acinetobacter sp. ANC 3813]OTG87335.1 hypothetical protein B9T34_16570 [Acinetobacter sp. ANC 3813]
MMFFLLNWALTALGFFALASSMSKHQKQIYGQELTAGKTKLAILVGWILLLLSLVICLASGPISNMISYWIGALSFAALFIGLCLSYLDKKLEVIAVILAILSVAFALIYFL